MDNYSILIPSYTVGCDAYRQIPKYCSLYGQKAVVIGGCRAMNAARTKLLSATEGSSIRITDFLLYGTDATYEAAAALCEHPRVREADMIFAVGGGKAVDTSKLVALRLGKPFLLFPRLHPTVRLPLLSPSSTTQTAPSGISFIIWIPHGTSLSTRRSSHMHPGNISGQESGTPMPNTMK